MDLTAVTDFNLVARHGGFGAASRATATPKATLSRRVRELEDSLGVRLIERGVRPLRLTEEGALLHARTEAPFGAISDALRDGQVDIVIRANPRPDDDLVGRCVLRNPLVLVAPPGLPQPANDHAAFPAVMRTGMVDGDAWSIVDARDGTARHYRPRAVLRLSSPLSIRDAVVAGAGAALVPLAIVADDIAGGRLVQWGASTQPLVEVWVLHASRRLVSTKVSAFVDFIYDYFKDQRPAA